MKALFGACYDHSRTCYPFDAVLSGGPMRYIVQAVLISDNV